jgi:hypothetical protein
MTVKIVAVILERELASTIKEWLKQVKLLPDLTSTKGMAERVGFEPTIPVKVCPLSRRIVSTTHAPLRSTAASDQHSAKSNC